MTRRKLACDNTPRHCSRCQAALDDIASRNLGYGPVCAKKNSHLMAKAISANYPQALIFALSVNPSELAPETVETWQTANKRLLVCAERASKNSTDMFSMSESGEDLREIIRACDFLCSFDHPSREIRSYMIQIIRALGYIGLAGVIAGQASTSASKIWFENGRVYMTGLGNTSGWRTMKKIPGIMTPRFRGDRSPYSAPVSSMKAFFDAVQTHWPMYEGDIAVIEMEANTWLAIQPTPVQVDVLMAKAVPLPDLRSAQAPKAPGQSPGLKKVNEAVITLRSEDAVLRFNWVRGANMFGFMAALKGVCAPKERSYNPVTKEWSFVLAQLPHLIEVITAQEIFGEPTVVDAGPDMRALTPAGLYGMSKAPYRGRRQGSWRGNYAR